MYKDFLGVVEKPNVEQKINANFMKRLLVIDDSEVNLFLIESVFEEDSNIEVILESQSTKAFEVIKEVKPDLILLDLMMPEIDGFDLLQKLKSEETLKQIAIIVISAKTDEDTIKQASEFGILSFLKKPIILSQIEEAIREALAYIC